MRVISNAAAKLSVSWSARDFCGVVEEVGELVSAAAVPAADVSWPFRPGEAANVPEADPEMVAVEGEVTALVASVVDPEETEAPANDN